MPDINVSLDFIDHPKNIRLRALLKEDSAEIYPIRLWIFTAKYHPETAILPDYKEGELIAFLGSKNPNLINAMCRVGYLEQIDGGWVVVGFLEHNGHIASFKKRARLAAKMRWSKLKPVATSNAKRNTKQCPNYTILTIPTIEELEQYFIEINSSKLEANKMFDYFQSNGWKVGGRAPMKDWKAAARNWKRNARKFETPEAKTIKEEMPRREKWKPPADSVPPPEEFRKLVQTIGS
jgi:hypothetical protein